MRILAVSLTALIVTACGGASFLGNTQSKGAPATSADAGKDSDSITASDAATTSGTIPTETKESTDPTVVGSDTVKGGTVVIQPPTKKDKDALASCAKAWGLKAPESYESVRKIFANISIGSDDITLQDNSNTKDPALTLVFASVNVGGTPTWQLTNPNGWYCVVVTVNVGTQLTVKLSKTGHLADSRVALDVGSKTDGPISAIGVNVGSDIKVERQ